MQRSQVFPSINGLCLVGSVCASVRECVISLLDYLSKEIRLRGVRAKTLEMWTKTEKKMDREEKPKA